MFIIMLIRIIYLEVAVYKIIFALEVQMVMSGKEFNKIMAEQNQQIVSY